MTVTNGPDGTVEQVEVVAAPERLAGWLWDPAVGQETRELLTNFRSLTDDAARTRVQEEARDVLARCAPPTPGSKSETGLAIGYVQSGKTMSFTTVAALARDNGYRIVVIITGTSKPLTQQSRERLSTDLRLNSRDDFAWYAIQEEQPAQLERRAVQVGNILAQWNRPGQHRTVFITVMKHHLHLGGLVRMLRQIALTQDLAAVPALIIDDEADQAGLNTLVQQQDVSTTYGQLLALKAALPCHSYIQYTATPQALVLISLIDVLSPRFVVLLTPGSDYVGGRHFFSEDSPLCRVIPLADIPPQPGGRGRQQPPPMRDPPPSLRQALRVFYLGVAAGLSPTGAGSGNRSMMIHPSHPTAGHRQFLRWVRAIQGQWADILRLPPTDRDRVELLRQFQESYTDLAQTERAIPAFAELEQWLLDAVTTTEIREVNASQGGRTPIIEWRNNYSFILVGGQAMDRGFTVQGLTVTYMPRGLGGGNADTVQQRARFFGYKGAYRGYCRVYLDSTTLAAFREYVKHEEDLRARLKEYARTGRPLTDWRREFLLTERLRPTRDEVIGQSYVHESVRQDSWTRTLQPHISPPLSAQNHAVVRDFLARYQGTFSEFPGDARRTPAQRHQYSIAVPLRDVLDSLLSRLRFPYLHDSQAFTAILLIVEHYLRDEDTKDACCAIVQMATEPGQVTRERALNDGGSIENLFQGPNPSNSGVPQGSIYPGDRAIFLPDMLTIQLHRVRLHPPGNRNSLVAEDVYAIAARVTDKMATGAIMPPGGRRP